MEFNFLKFLFENNKYGYLKDFESDLSEYLYSVDCKKISFKLYLRRQLLNFIASYFIGNKNKYFVNDNVIKNSIISDSYFNLNDKLRELNYKVSKSPWSLDKNNTKFFNYHLFRLFDSLKEKTHNGLEELLSQEFINIYESFQNDLFTFISNVNPKALILPADVTFYQKALIRTFKKIDKPTFIYLHGGMPTTFRPYRFNSTDYLLVWGEKHKEKYVENGFEKKKIIVTGHPYYTKIIQDRRFRFGLDNILVLSKPTLGSQKNDGHVALQSRANRLLYLYGIQDLLLSLGVKSVKLRLHPSENQAWYKKNISNSFFILDNDNLKKSLSLASLVIGPLSTVFIEAIYYGVNYIFYEPVDDNNRNMNGLQLESPFTDNDGKIPFATSIDELKYILKTKKQVDPSVLNDYIKTPFDLSEVTKVINKYK